MEDILKYNFDKRTHYSTDLSKANINENVVLNGWVAKIRNLGSLIFIDIRDISGICQLVIKDEQTEIFELAKHLKPEYVISATGAVELREAANLEISTGEIEIIVDKLELLNTSLTPPIYIKDDDNVSDEMRLKYRYLDLRKSTLQKNLIQRSEIMKAFRDFLHDHHFIEIETPFLTKPTPEGARDYLVPSRVNKNKFYALPQSPQLMKQLLMVSGMDRYYQIVKCFRDEDLRANRQPEFTQVDMEMSFVEMDDVMQLNENLIAYIFKEILNIDIALPIRRIQYREAIERYGTDKPDLRVDFSICDVTSIFTETEFDLFSNTIKSGGTIRGINFKNLGEKYSRKNIEKLIKYTVDFGNSNLFWIKIDSEGYSSSFKKFITKECFDALDRTFNFEINDLVLIICGERDVVTDSLASLRVNVAREQNLLDPKKFELAWVTEFPLFEIDRDTNQLTSKHHPFTHPMNEDLSLLDTNPEQVRSLAYDIVINGEEIGGGSIRINDSDLQRKIFETLKLSKEDIQEKFGFFADAMKYGAPPHGGIAYGLDRFVMLLTATDNIKDVIAFPKTQSATCLMSGAPSDVTEAQLDELNLSLKH